MTIKWVSNMSIFDHLSNVALVNPVNCKGVMGKGLAKEFKQRWPSMFKDYLDVCELGLSPGEFVVHYPSHNAPDPTIICFPTKIHWRDKSQYVYIHAGLDALSNYLAKSADINKVAFPKLGCGLGGLAWPEVRTLMVEHLGPLDVTCYIHGSETGDQ